MCNIMPPDDGEEELFGRSRLRDQIIALKRNDPNLTNLVVDSGNLNAKAWRRLGRILGRNARVKELGLQGWGAGGFDVRRLCAAGGLCDNRSVTRLWLGGIDFEANAGEGMAALAPFLIENASLSMLCIVNCNIGPESIRVLSSALSIGPKDALEEVSISNVTGGVDLERIAPALRGCRGLAKLWLTHNGIRPGDCAALGPLLEDKGHALASLHLDDNFLDDKAAAVLAGALRKNTKLKQLTTRGNIIGARGWKAVLMLVCDRSCVSAVVGSNHELRDLGMQLLPNDRASVERVLGRDDANLLRASLDANRCSNKCLVARRKVLWCHARGDFNIGCTIAPALVPRVLSWFGSGTMADVDCRDPPLPESGIDAVRLDAIFRIVRTTPDLYLGKEHHVRGNDDTANKLKNPRSKENPALFWGTLFAFIMCYRLSTFFEGMRHEISAFIVFSLVLPHPGRTPRAGCLCASSLLMLMLWVVN